MRNLSALLLVPLFFLSCAPHFDPQTLPKEQQKLTRMLSAAHPGIDPAEARKVAGESIRYSRILAKRYRVASPPLIHNFLTNVGLRERGLCYQWSDDLYRHLRKFHFRTLHFKPVGAHIGSYWREHNALVVLPTGSHDLHRGILLDPWRASGKLYFVPILKDPAYHWKIRTDRCDVYPNYP